MQWNFGQNKGLAKHFYSMIIAVLVYVQFI